MLRSTRCTTFSTDIWFGLAIAGFTATTAPHFYFTNSMEINTETAGERVGVLSWTEWLEMPELAVPKRNDKAIY